MKNIKYFPHFVGGPGAVGLLVLRFVFGLGMMYHGADKIKQPFGWMGPKSDIPGIFQAAAALSEFGGGAALIFGLLTPLAALGIAATMLVAYFKAHFGDPFVAKGGGRSFELAALYFSAAFMLLTLGPGKLSLDFPLFKKFAMKG